MQCVDFHPKLVYNTGNITGNVTGVIIYWTLDKLEALS
jgi:hypothetical protein